MASPIQSVADTAYLVAHYRAVETRRPDALFQDPLAARLVGHRSAQFDQTFGAVPMSGWSVVIRTRLIDELILDLVRGGVDTVINLGAGMDTRAYRLDLPKGLRWVEVDQAHVLAEKERLLVGENARCQLERVALDLSQEEPRRLWIEKESARSGRRLLLTEGVVPYLDQDEVAALAHGLHRLPNVAAWMVDYFSPVVVRYRQRLATTRQMDAAPFKFAPEDWRVFFSSRGWRVEKMHSLFAAGRRYGRHPPLPWKARVLTALTRLLLGSGESKGESVGYAVLVPE